MSGGHYEYIQFKLDETIKQMEKDYKNESGYIKDDSILVAIQHTLSMLKMTRTYIHRIDWLMSGDDGEDSFFTRLQEDIDRGRI